MLKNELAFIKEEEIYTTSLLVSEKTETAHKHILDLIRRILSNLTADLSAVKYNPKFIEAKFTNNRGREYLGYYLNRPAFSLLMMRMHSARAYEWQIKFNDSFYQLEEAVKNHSKASWIESRDELREQRKEITDTIKLFVDYATEQGSKHAQFYYSSVTNCTYKALELINQNKTTPIRDFLSIKQIGFLMTAETIAQNSLIEGMNKKMHYKEIYLLAKEKLTEYNKLIYIKPVEIAQS